MSSAAFPRPRISICSKWARARSTASCAYCTSEDIDYEERLKIGVTAKEQHVTITLFDAAHYFFCCDVKEYVHSTSKKKEESAYYQKMIV
ncbi:hypothetical protein KY284_010968 [Solanum tuberosum]|nr:hypothetical protein KY284_010968 [Solanum tuberosum]